MLFEQYRLELDIARANGLDDVPHVQLTLLDEQDIPDNVRNIALHPRQVNQHEIQNEICAIYVSADDNVPPERKGFTMRLKNANAGNQQAAKNYTMSLWSRHVDGASYPFLFPYGDPGYHLFIRREAYDNAPPPKNANVVDAYDPENEETIPDEEIETDIVDANESSKKRQYVSVREFYRWHLALRKDKTGEGHFLWPWGQLAQQYLIDQSFKVDQSVYSYLRRMQGEGKLCVTSEDVRRSIAAGLRPGEELGLDLVKSKW